MAIYSIAVVSQKGGVGKSALARTLATEFSRAGWETKIADLDVSQGTSTEWTRRRKHYQLEPDVQAEPCGNILKAKRLSEGYDLLIFDGQPHASQQTLKVAAEANLVVIPLKIGADEKAPALNLAKALAKKGIEPLRIAFLFNQIADADAALVRDTYEDVVNHGFPTSPNYIRYRTAYSRALDQGKALTEVTHAGLKKEAQAAIGDLISHFNQLTNQAGAA